MRYIKYPILLLVPFILLLVMVNGCIEEMNQTFFEVASSIPTLEATGVVYSADVEMTFTLPILGASLTLDDIFAAYGSGHTAGTPDLSQARMTWSNQSKTLTISGIRGWSELTGSSGPKNVHVISAADRIVALSGDKMAAGRTLLKFSLSAKKGIQTVYPADGATGVTSATSVEVTFTDDMDPTTITTDTFTLWGSQISGTVAYDAATRTATFTPDDYLGLIHTYTASIGAQVKYADGTELGDSYRWSFTTGDDSPPQASSVSPLDGATDVSIATTVSVVFDKEMDSSTINTSTFILEGSSGTVSYVPSTRTATLVPSVALTNSKQYTARLSTQIKDSIGNNMAAVYSWSFTTEAASEQLVYEKNGLFDYDVFGISVAGAGDVNNDGYDDFIVGGAIEETVWPGLPAGVTGAQKAYVYSGADGSLLHEISSPTTEAILFGAKVAGVGDTNGDGYDDFLVAAPWWGPNQEGKIYLYSGLDGTMIRTHECSVTSATFGSAVAGAGDVNRDTYADYMAGAPYSAATSGEVYVFSGLDGSQLHQLVGPKAAYFMGVSVSGLGDVNGDGYADFLAGSIDNVSQNGLAHLFSGKDGSVLWYMSGENGYDHFGVALSSVGDVNGDSIPDFAVGAPYMNTRTGRVYVFSGASRALLYTISGDYTGQFLGGSLSGGMDVNGDGYADLIVGNLDPLQYYTTYNYNRAYVYSGVDGTHLWTGIGTSRAFYGLSVGAVGNIDNSGRGAFIVGAPFSSASGNINAGRAYVYQLK
jgi:hypothetical protein